MQAAPKTAETPNPLDDELTEDLKAALKARYQNELGHDPIALFGHLGKDAARLRLHIGVGGSLDKVHEFDVFVRDQKKTGIDGGLGLLLDFLDDVLRQFFEADRDAYLPLDFVSYPFEDAHVLARSAFRDLAAEAMAEALLKDGGRP